MTNENPALNVNFSILDPVLGSVLDPVLGSVLGPKSSYPLKVHTHWPPVDLCSSASLEGVKISLIRLNRSCHIFRRSMRPSHPSAYFEESLTMFTRLFQGTFVATIFLSTGVPLSSWGRWRVGRLLGVRRACCRDPQLCAAAKRRSKCSHEGLQTPPRSLPRDPSLEVFKQEEPGIT